MKTFLLAVILIIGTLLRSEEVIRDNYLFLKDQGRDMLDIKSVWFDRKLTLIGPYTGLQGVFQGPLYYYLMALPAAVSHGNPRVVLAFIVALQVFAIAMMYVTGKRFFSETVGLIAAFVFAVSPVAAAASTFIWSPHITLPVMTVFLYGFLLWMEKQTLKRFLFAVSCLGVLYHFEIAFALPLTIAVFLLCIALAGKKFFPQAAILFAVVVVIWISPLIVFDVRHNFITSTSLVRLVSGKPQGLGDTFEPFLKINRDHLYRFETLLWSSFVDQKQPVSRPLTIGFAAIILWFLWKGSKQLRVISAIPLLLYSAYIVYPFQIYQWYIMGLIPVIVLVFAAAADRLRMLPGAIVIVFLVLSAVGSDAGERLINLYGRVDHGGTAKVKGKLAAIDTVYEDAKGEQFSLHVFTPVVLTDAYDYLLWWHGRRKYGYLPGDTKSGTFYLIAEPDAGKPWSYKGWMETVIATGDVVWTKELPSGFVIEKRVSAE